MPVPFRISTRRPVGVSSSRSHWITESFLNDRAADRAAPELLGNWGCIDPYPHPTTAHNFAKAGRKWEIWVVRLDSNTDSELPLTLLKHLLQRLAIHAVQLGCADRQRWWHRLWPAPVGGEVLKLRFRQRLQEPFKPQPGIEASLLSQPFQSPLK